MCFVRRRLTALEGFDHRLDQSEDAIPAEPRVVPGVRSRGPSIVAVTAQFDGPVAVEPGRGRGALDRHFTHGLAPVVGVPLPLVSYGGTVMLTIMAGFGIVMSAHVSRDQDAYRASDSLL